MKQISFSVLTSRLGGEDTAAHARLDAWLFENNLTQTSRIFYFGNHTLTSVAISWDNKQ